MMDNSAVQPEWQEIPNIAPGVKQACLDVENQIDDFVAYFVMNGENKLTITEITSMRGEMTLDPENEKRIRLVQKLLHARSDWFAKPTEPAKRETEAAPEAAPVEASIEEEAEVQ